jgi:hypothetical protein
LHTHDVPEEEEKTAEEYKEETKKGENDNSNKKQ